MLLLLLMPNVDVELSILGQEESLPTLLEVSSFLYDFNLGYELSRLATDPDYSNFRFSHFALYRKGRPLSDDARLRVMRISHNSPIAVETLLWGAPLVVGALWGVVQIAEKVSNWKLNRTKLEEEIRKLQRENRTAETPKAASEHPKRVTIYTEEEFTAQIREREAAPLLDQVANRLARSKVRIKDVQIRFVRRSTKIEEK